MRELLIMAIMVLTWLAVFSVIQIYWANRTLKKLDNAKDRESQKKIERAKRLLKTADFKLAIVMLLKVIIEINIIVPTIMWIVDMLLMSIVVTELFVKYVIRKDPKQTR